MEYLAKIKEFEAKTGRELDAIIMPVTATAAIRHNQFKYYGYATAINVLDFTSVVVPVTFADKSVDKRPDGFKPLTEMDGTVNAECKLRPFLGLLEFWTDVLVDDPEAYHGAPAAVQIVGRRFTEERIIAIAEEVGRLLKQ